VPEGGPSLLPRDSRRLVLQCIKVLNDQKIIEAARSNLAVAKNDPSPALVLVHGYNVLFENAVRRTAQLAYDLKFDGGVFLFNWPSEGSLWAYFLDRDPVDIAVKHLEHFIEDIVAQSKARKIHFVAHSMGNMVLLALMFAALAEEEEKRNRSTL